MQFLRKLRNASTAVPATKNDPQPSAAADDGDSGNKNTPNAPVLNPVDNSYQRSGDGSGQEQGTGTTPSPFGGQPASSSTQDDAASSASNPAATTAAAATTTTGQTLSAQPLEPPSAAVPFPHQPPGPTSAATAASTPGPAPRTQEPTYNLQDPQNLNQPLANSPVTIKSMTGTNEPSRTDPRVQQQDTTSHPQATAAAIDPWVASSGSRQTAVPKPAVKSTSAATTAVMELQDPAAAAPSPRTLHQQMKEERLQALTAAHKETLRRLAVERHQIAQQQSLYGAAGPMTAATVVAAAGHNPPPLWRPASNEDSREVRAAARQQMIEQLQTEQVAALAALKALKQGKTLDEARRIGNVQYQHQYQQQQQPQQQQQQQDQANMVRIAAAPQAPLSGLPRSSSVLLRHREQGGGEEEGVDEGARGDPPRRGAAGHRGSNADLGPPTPTRGSSPTIQGRGPMGRRGAVESIDPTADRAVRVGGIGGSTGGSGASSRGSFTSPPHSSLSMSSSSPLGPRGNAVRLATGEADVDSGGAESRRGRGGKGAGGLEAPAGASAAATATSQPANDQQLHRQPTDDQPPPSYIEELKEQVKVWTAWRSTFVFRMIGRTMR
ncbi:hypothetical protein Vretimale_6622 [Volvox reticuliferus]|uniref:Uncharacterized protein n=1 Tax=Volvox reticuliferus TaxID=1737510 RepID=A0A8J4G862_9CHLO|nr:hypothetical protein Vretimale_6622 [Volvox reticuliferus]